MMLNTAIFSQFFLISLINSKRIWEINEGRRGVQFGDMVLTPYQLRRYVHNATSQIRGVSLKDNGHNRWPNNTLPYVVSPQFTTPQKNTIIRSMKDMELLTCFRFVERTKEQDYILIVPLDGCYSYVGRTGGRQLLSLSDDCVADYIIWHELMHAIGFEHEHQRPDRDSFIKVEYANVIPGQLSNFERIHASLVDFPFDYDYKSIMHYDSFAFGNYDPRKNQRLATMTPLKAGVDLIDNMHFSETDIAKLNALGGCSKPVAEKEDHKEENGGKVCVDMSPDCVRLQQKGLCMKKEYSVLASRFCARSCGHCKAKEARTCKDERSLCGSFSKKCKNPTYRRLLHKICKRTCGSCEIKEITHCSDTGPDCEKFATLGLCTNAFYRPTIQAMCAKTCKLC